MPDGRVPKDVLYGELVAGVRSVGRQFLRFKGVCKRDTKFAELDINAWGSVVEDRGLWEEGGGLWRAQSQVLRGNVPSPLLQK